MGRGSRKDMQAMRGLDELLAEEPRSGVPAWMQPSPPTSYELLEAIAAGRLENLQIASKTWSTFFDQDRLQRLLTLAMTPGLTLLVDRHWHLSGAEWWELKGGRRGVTIGSMGDDQQRQELLLERSRVLRAFGDRLLADTPPTHLVITPQTDGRSLLAEEGKPLQLAFPGDGGRPSKTLPGVGPVELGSLLLAIQYGADEARLVAEDQQLLKLRNPGTASEWELIACESAKNPNSGWLFTLTRPMASELCGVAERMFVEGTPRPPF